jgi:AcrR family transcriptional regulator
LRADDNQRRLMEASSDLFAERGYLGTSVNDLLERAGLTRNAFYSYFPSKEALAVAIVEHTAAQWPPLIARFRALRAPAVDTVIALSLEVADRFREDVVVRAGTRLSLERDTVKTPLPPPFHGWAEEIEGLLSPAGEWELMGLSTPADVAARVIVTCLIGVQYLSGGPEGREQMGRRLTEMWTVLLPGLRPTPDPSVRIAAAQALRERVRTEAAEVDATDVAPADLPAADRPPVGPPPADLLPPEPPADLPPANLPPADLPPVEVRAIGRASVPVPEPGPDAGALTTIG